MLKAIVYTSNTGTTEEYAKLLAGKTGLPVYPLAEAKKTLDPGTPILYMGWLMAAGIKGYAEAAKLFEVSAVCAVGMGPTGAQLEEVRTRNALPESLPLFTLQGGLRKKKLHGLNKLILSVVCSSGAKSLLQKPNRTPEDETMLDLLKNGGDRVCEENLQAVLAWYEQQ